MKSNNTFGVHFILQTSRIGDDNKFPVYARIVVNGTRTEFSMKNSISKADWNFGKGEAKPKNPELRAFNSYLQEMQGKLYRHYRDLQLEDEPLTAAAVKAAYLSIEKEILFQTTLDGGGLGAPDELTPEERRRREKRKRPNF